MKLFHRPAGKRRLLTSAQIIIGGFLLVILTGSLLLMLPFASRESGCAPFMDCLFTATSATCVTGLIVHDTATYWTPFGQAVLLLLIQIGGMGVVTMALSVTIFSGRKIGLLQRSTMQESISAPHMGGIVRMTGFILKVTALTELAGALLMAPVFCRKFGIFKGIWYAVFHSVSAFCNAGFDLMGAESPFSSLSGFVGNPLINLVIMFLIIFGGIGFYVWDDMRTNHLHFRRYRLQSKVVLAATAVLVLLPAVYYYFVEFSAPQWQNLTVPERVLASFFQSVTTRTAGFNTVDLSAMTETGQTLMIPLMLIGGSPGSTAGGMKTTTAAVLLLTAAAVCKRREDPQCFDRRITSETVKNAGALLLIYILLFVTGGFVISCVEGLPVVDSFFETASAIGTAGLSLGLTPTLGTVSRIVLILLMFCGRVGTLTLVFAAHSGAAKTDSRLPQERLTVG
jgi:trk system potassium uptake protein TrkH